PGALATQVAEMPLLVGSAAATGTGEMHEADRLVLCAATWAGDARRGDGDVDAGRLPRALGHGAGDLLGHRPMALDKRRGYPDHFFFGAVVIGDEAAEHSVGRAGHVSQRRGDKAAGATFYSDDHLAAGGEGVIDGLGSLAQFDRYHSVSLGSSMLA